MIRPFTCICMLMAAGAGLYLYQTKHRAQLLDREIAHTYKQIEQTKDRIGVLKGEWALLNEPERLAELARQHLNLRTLAPLQFVALADLGSRLPAPLPPGTFIVPAPDEILAPAIPAPPPLASAPVPPASLPVAAAKPMPAANGPKTPPASVQLAVIPPSVPPPMPHQPPRAATPAAIAPVATLPAVPRAAASPSLAPRITAPIVNVSASSMAAPHPAPAPSTTVAAAPIAPSFGSALGSAGHVPLPAPVPYAAALISNSPLSNSPLSNSASR